MPILHGDEAHALVRSFLALPPAAVPSASLPYEDDIPGHVASVKVYLDHTSSPPTLRIEVVAGPSEDAPSSLYQDFEVQLPEREDDDPAADEANDANEEASA